MNEGDRSMDQRDRSPGPIQEEKRGETFDRHEVQPQAAEVESARLLANQARESLAADGLSDDEIRSLADDYVAQDRGESLGGFIEWAREHRGFRRER